ncbi:hypothetical protein D3875_13850 [Deinococcus cavernae]|uniref:Uncharacterized protein n=1 Tax=Deinococcus cavernae TaxID=2320857 RepID=A0A418V8U1_9DEIO|nr:hypothetical protein [Deinococcus cavernae]RJF72472.1 hypothetical protein D3875_13850 [Deinococcus cavernae]
MALLLLLVLWPALSGPVRTVPSLRVAAPPSFLGGRRVELVRFSYFRGYFSNAMLDGYFELRCSRFPWLRVRQPDPLTPPWEGVPVIRWGRDSSVLQPQARVSPVVFSGESLNVLRFCP